MLGLGIEKWEEFNGLNTTKEISQQPEMWLEVFNGINANKDAIKKFIDKNLNKEKIKVIFSGAGTSSYIGEILISELNRGEKDIYQAVATTDIVTNPSLYLKKHIPTLLVSFARSGNSPESVATYNLANELIDDISHIFITCNKDGELAQISKDKNNILLLLMPEESNDKGFAMTSSFSSMLLAALLIFDLDSLEDNKNQVIEMIHIGREVLETKNEELNILLDYDFERIVYLGSGSYYGLSKESSLKLLELTRGQIFSLSETPLGFRHGPKSILDNKTLVFIFISEDDYSRKYDFDLLNEIYNDEGKHKIISISNKYRKEIEKISDYHIYLTKEKNHIMNRGFISLLYALYAQIFALKTSVKSKVEPDNPNPSGLVNRVVQGVNIYKYK